MYKYVDEIKWLNAEIEQQKKRFAEIKEGRKALESKIIAQRGMQAKLQAELSQQEASLKQAERQVNAETEQMAAEVAAAQKVSNEKQQILSKTANEKAELETQLSNLVKQTEHIIENISSLNHELLRLQEDIVKKRKLVSESKEIPRKQEKLEERKTRAMELVPGFVLKATFAEELLNEEPSFKAEWSSKLTEYKTLCKQLKELSLSMGKID
jgi:DNA repair exonuclease SbcCD ATPase subunit